MTNQSELSPESTRINQDTRGNRNQTIGQIHGGIVVYVSGGQAIINPADVAAIESDKPGSQKLGPNPYKGLLAFNENDGDRYFGRSDEIQQLWSKLRDLYGIDGKTRLLPIYGPSGSGKSSLARAGLLPELGRRPLPGREKARVAVLVPGNDPLYSLAVVLAKIATEDPNPVEKADEFKRVLKRSDDSGEFNGLNRIAFGLPEISTSPLIVLVDQFEEIYSYEPRGNSPDNRRKREKFVEERNAFVKNILYAASDRSQYVSVIITFRSDFLGETHKHPTLSQLFSEPGFLVTAMGEDALEQAIAQPAEVAGHPLDSATVNLLVQETIGREGTLPLLQVALTRIWEALPNKEPGQTLQEIGGVGGALADEAEGIYQGLSRDEKAIAQRAFLGLVQLGEGTQDTRRRVELNTLVAAHEGLEKVRNVVERFSNRDVRLITLSSDRETESTTAEVTHEALLERWQPLREWLDTEREDIRFQRRFEAAAQYWYEQGQPDGLLWRLPDLDLLRNFVHRCEKNFTPLQPTDLQLEFYRSSLKRQEEEELAEQERAENVKKRLQAEKKAAYTLALASLAIAAAMGISTLIAWRSVAIVNYQKDVTEAVFLGTSTPEIIASLPELEASAEQLRAQIDTLPAEVEPEMAIAHYQEHQADFIKLFAYYRNILTTAGRLSRETNQDEALRIEDISTTLGSLLNKYRVPQLELDLVNSTYSEFLEGQPVTKFEDQYSAGAVKTTYEILMTNTGAGADLNKDGFIADVQEASQMPCEVLQRIEELWRQATQRSCGWYPVEGPYAQDDDCKPLNGFKDQPNEVGSTLYVSIFDYDAGYAVERIKKDCGIRPE